MTEAQSANLIRFRREYARCFGCGPDNPMGLQLDGFERDGSTVRANLVPRPEYRGFSDILHGGIVATALDEILAWSAILVANTMVVTGKLDLATATRLGRCRLRSRRHADRRQRQTARSRRPLPWLTRA